MDWFEAIIEALHADREHPSYTIKYEHALYALDAIQKDYWKAKDAELRLKGILKVER